MEAVREARAKEVERLGKFLWRPSRPSTPTQGPGMFTAGPLLMLIYMLATMSASTETSPSTHAMDDLEAKHSVNKQLQLRLSNSIPGQRMKTIMSHHVLRESVVQQAKVILYHAHIFDLNNLNCMFIG